MFFISILILAFLPWSDALAVKNEYYPLQVGNVWKYKQLESGRKFEQKVTQKIETNQKETYIVETIFSGNTQQKEFYNLSETGVLTVSRAMQTGTFNFEPEQFFIKYPLNLGESWEQNGSVLDTKRQKRYEYKISCKYEAIVKIKVPAGAFRAIRAAMKVEVSDGSHSIINRYFVNGVGVVKEEINVMVNGRKVTASSELISYSLNQ